MHYSTLKLFSASAVFISLIHGSPIDRRASASVTRVEAVEFLGHVKSSTTDVVRDLGFPGQIDDIPLLTYGDTLFKDSANPDAFLGMTSNSAAISTTHPLVVEDKNLGSNGYPEQFVGVEAKWGEDMSTDAMGITNVVPTTPGNAVVFFLKNHRPNGDNTLIGSGVASVVMDNGVPKATRLAEYWWDATKEPHYGDVTAMRFWDQVYAYGHGPNSDYVFAARAHYEHATDLSAYEYWNGEDWQKERLINPGEKEAIWWQIGQGQLSWNPHLNKFLFVYSGKHTIAPNRLALMMVEFGTQTDLS
jgi:hypothetical protein